MKLLPLLTSQLSVFINCTDHCTVTLQTMLHGETGMEKAVWRTLL